MLKTWDAPWQPIPPRLELLAEKKVREIQTLGRQDNWDGLYPNFHKGHPLIYLDAPISDTSDGFTTIGETVEAVYE